MPKNAEKLAETLRQQILKGVETGLWEPGGKLPSTREMAASMDIDPRMVSEAYRELAHDGLVELRPRSGAYISKAARANGSLIAPSEGWIAELLADSVARELPLAELAEWVRRSTETLRLRAFVVAATDDQVHGLRRELQKYYGLEVGGSTTKEIETRDDLPAELRRSDLVITTAGSLGLAQKVAGTVGVSCICVTVRFDLIGSAWKSLMQSPSYAVVTDETFGEVLTTFVASQTTDVKPKVLIAGKDDLSVIPVEAVVYVTQSARERLGDAKLNGTILPPVRLLSRESSYELTSFIVRANLAAMRSRPGR